MTWALVRSILVLLVAAFLLMAGTGPLGTAIGVRLQGVAAPSLVIGGITAGYFAGLTTGALLAYKVVAAVGHIRAFTAFASIISASALAYAVHLDYGLWVGLRLVDGFCMAGLFICIESWLNDSAPSEARGKLLATYMVCLYAGQGVGQALLPLDAGGGFLMFVAVSMLLSAAVVPMALTRMAPPPLPDVRSTGLRRLYQTSPLGMLGALSSGLVIGAFYGLGAVFAREIGLDLGDTALFISAAILGGVLLQWPVGWLSDVFDRRHVLVWLLAGLSVVSFGLTVAVGWDDRLMFGLIGLFGGSAFAVYPIAVAHTNDHLDRSERVSASGGLVLAYSLGATFGPLMASGLMSAAGPIGLYLFTGSIAAVAFLFGLWRMRVALPVPLDQQEPFQPLPRTTPVAAPLDPRSDAPAA